MKEENPYDTPEYQIFVEECAKHCMCHPASLRPCDGALCGLCDSVVESEEDDSK